MSAEAYVKSSDEGGVVTIEFFHPQSNSLPSAILNQLAMEIMNVGALESTRLIVLKSGGDRAFCAGASFDELTRITSVAEGKIFFSGFAKVINAIRTCGKIVIARIQGKCVGGGVGLAAAADYSIATHASDVKLSELAVGIGPFVVGPAIERKIGVSAFSALALDAASWRSSQWAQEKGIFTEVHDSVELTDHAVRRLADFLLKSSPDALAELKQIFWRGTEHWDGLLEERAGISGRLVTGEYAQNAIRAALAATKK